MDAASFKEKLRERLRGCGDRILLRIVLSAGADPVSFTGADLLEQSEALVARHLASPRPLQDPGAGSRSGSAGAILLLLPHSVELYLLHLGLVLRGYLPAILAWPTSRVDAEKYQRNLLHQLKTLPADQVITLPSLAQNLTGHLTCPVTACPVAGAAQFEKLFSARFEVSSPRGVASVDSVDPAAEGAPPAAEGPSAPPIAGGPVPPEGALFLQFSGGTTGAQKAVVITASMLSTQLDRLGWTLGLRDDDGVVSWLPMYHDMGLIACLWLPLWHGIPSLHLAASDWILRPELLFEHLDRFRGTLAWMPNFAFSYLAQARSRISGGYALGHVRAFINCSEPVRSRSMDSFVDTFAEWGVTASSLQTSYAMAENVFAVTQSRLGSRPARVARGRLAGVSTPRSDLAYELLDESYVSSGEPLPEMEVRVVDSSGAGCPPFTPGEIRIRTACLFAGYWGTGGFSGSSLSEDGWYATGDCGFLGETELYVMGRSKDIIIVAGQNIFPEDVEVIVNAVAGVYPGRAVAFGLPNDEHGTESLAIVAELKGDFDAAAAARVGRDINKTVLAMIGIAPRHVAVVPERWIVKSTAGKISRIETRERFRREKLRPPAPGAGS